MGRQIIRQPNGLYCIWSTVVDDVVYCDLTREDWINMRIKEEKEKIIKDINEICDKLDRGEDPYFQFTKTYRGVARRVNELRKVKEVDIHA